MRFHHRAFTIIELLVVIAIIAILMSLVIPVLGQAKAQSRMVICATHLYDNGRAIALYGIDNKDAYPDFNYTWNPGNSGIIIVQYVPKKAATTGWNIFNPACMVCPDDPSPATVHVLDDQTGGIKDYLCSYDMNLDFLMRGIKQNQVTTPFNLALMFEGEPGSTVKQGAYMGTLRWSATALGDAHMGKFGNVLWADGHVSCESDLPVSAFMVPGTPLINGPGNSSGGGSGGNGGSGGSGGTSGGGAGSGGGTTGGGGTTTGGGNGGGSGRGRH